jgi:hypothetical protein
MADQRWVIIGGSTTRLEAGRLGTTTVLGNAEQANLDCTLRQRHGLA